MSVNHLVSIILPVFNGKKFIRRAIQSVTQQSYPFWELIIVDDCSVDNTVSIVNEFLKDLPNVLFIRNSKNRGPGYSRNVAINRASGEFVAILDADDYWHPNKLELQIKTMLNSNASIVTTNMILYNADGHKFKYKYSKYDLILRYNLFHLKKFPPHSSHLYRLKHVKKVGAYNSDMPKAQDFHMWLKLASLGKIININKCLTTRYNHPNNITNNNNGFSQSIYAVASLVQFKEYSKNGKFESIIKIDEKFLAYISKNGYYYNFNESVKWFQDLRAKRINLKLHDIFKMLKLIKIKLAGWTHTDKLHNIYLKEHLF